MRWYKQSEGGGLFEFYTPIGCGGLEGWGGGGSGIRTGRPPLKTIPLLRAAGTGSAVQGAVPCDLCAVTCGRGPATGAAARQRRGTAGGCWRSLSSRRGPSSAVKHPGAPSQDAPPPPHTGHTTPQNLSCKRTPCLLSSGGFLMIANKSQRLPGGSCSFPQASWRVQ